MGPLNRAGWSSQLGLVTGGVRAMTPMTLGVGLVTRVTLHAHGHVTGREIAFPLVAICLDWVRGLTGATIWRAQCGATGPGFTTIMSVQGQPRERKNNLPHPDKSFCHIGTDCRPCWHSHNTCVRVSGNVDMLGLMSSTDPGHGRSVIIQPQERKCSL